jgi:hypothetical protein
LPATHRDPSISRINRFTNGEIALISLGIQASILSKERVACTPANAGRKASRPFVFCVPAIEKKTSRSALCQPKPIAHGIKQSKSFAVAQDAVPPVPPSSENQDH